MKDRRHINVILQQHLTSWEYEVRYPRFVVFIPGVASEMSLGELMRLRTKLDDAFEFLDEQRALL